ncbi:MAG: DUF1934 domain-containing protein [Lachnospiraceae bacterium]|nr:DUF1934 domain-containing protein [Lachnospiraceae bacterium]
MTKDVLVSLRGLQFEQSGEDPEQIETITVGNYYEKNGKHYVIYDEITEGFEELTKNRMKFNEQFLELTRTGLVNVHMVFEKNRKNMTSYQTPYGNIMIGIDTKQIQIDEQDDRIMVTVEYALDMNYEFLADCKIVLEIRSKEKREAFLL